ncbi:MAG: hypothetical protein CL912_11810 [Deltaproteobacteria bacterium]|nr:hypothetical protein [Deltaproteobacteria bacterium]
MQGPLPVGPLPPFPQGKGPAIYFPAILVTSSEVAWLQNSGLAPELNLSVRLLSKVTCSFAPEYLSLDLNVYHQLRRHDPSGKNGKVPMRLAPGILVRKKCLSQFCNMQTFDMTKVAESDMPQKRSDHVQLSTRWLEPTS